MRVHLAHVRIEVASTWRPTVLRVDVRRRNGDGNRVGRRRPGARPTTQARGPSCCRHLRRGRHTTRTASEPDSSDRSMRTSSGTVWFSSRRSASRSSFEDIAGAGWRSRMASTVRRMRSTDRLHVDVERSGRRNRTGDARARPWPDGSRLPEFHGQGVHGRDLDDPDVQDRGVHDQGENQT